MKKKEKPDNTADVIEEIRSPSLDDYPYLEFFGTFLFLLSPFIVIFSIGGLLWGIFRLSELNINLFESINLVVLMITLLGVISFIVCVLRDFIKYCKKLKKYLESNEDKNKTNKNL